MTNPITDAEALSNALAEIERLKGVVEQLQAEPAVQAEEHKIVDTVKHWLHLGNGEVVESTGAIPTHVAKEDGTVVPVTAAYEQQKVSS